MTAPLKLFITGDPGCGKTTALRAVVERLRGRVAMTGFLTDEVRREGRRQGFRGTTLEGATFVLADRDLDSNLKIGPYGVDVTGLESVGIAALVPGPETRLVVLDEVGKMEMLSEPFRRRVVELVAGDVPVLATIAATGVGLIKRLRNDPQVTLLWMRREARAAMPQEILRRLAAAGVVPGRDATGRDGPDRDARGRDAGPGRSGPPARGGSGS